ASSAQRSRSPWSRAGVATRLSKSRPRGSTTGTVVSTSGFMRGRRRDHELLHRRPAAAGSRRSHQDSGGDLYVNQPISRAELAWHIEQMEAQGVIVDSGRKRNGRTVWVMTPLGHDVLDRFRSGAMSDEEARRWGLLDE